MQTVFYSNNEIKGAHGQLKNKPIKNPSSRKKLIININIIICGIVKGDIRDKEIYWAHEN